VRVNCHMCTPASTDPLHHQLNVESVVEKHDDKKKPAGEEKKRTGSMEWKRTIAPLKAARSHSHLEKKQKPAGQKSISTS